MKTAIIFSDGIKQIVFTPENDNEKQTLKLITPDDNISLAVHKGNFGDKTYQPFTANIGKCRGGYLRVFNDEDSIILVLSPKEKNNNSDNPIAI